MRGKHTSQGTHDNELGIFYDRVSSVGTNVYDDLRCSYVYYKNIY